METYLPAVVAILRGASDVSRLVGACDAGVPLPVPGSMAPFGGDREEDRPAGVKEVVEGGSGPVCQAAASPCSLVCCTETVTTLSLHVLQKELNSGYPFSCGALLLHDTTPVG
jgi:hypothetical protein